MHRESTSAQIGGRKTVREQMIAEIIKTVNFFLMEKRFNNLFFNSFQACTLLFFSA